MDAYTVLISLTLLTGLNLAITTYDGIAFLLKNKNRA